MTGMSLFDMTSSQNQATPTHTKHELEHTNKRTRLNFGL